MTMTSRCWRLAFALFILLAAESVVSFPRQLVFIAQVDNAGNILEREERDVPVDLSTAGSGDFELSINDTATNAPMESPPAKIGSLHITSTTTARFTNTSVTSRLVNTAHIAQETEFVVRLPDEAFITELFIEVDGEVYRSTVETKQKSQKIYDTAIKRGQTASQVKQVKSEKVNEFSVSINVAARSEVKCTLIYQQLLLRKKGYFTNKISIRPNQVIPNLKVNVYITEPQGLEEVLYWLEKDDDNTNTIQEHEEKKATITSSTKTHIQFYVSEEEQLTQSENGIMGDFVIKYDVIHPMGGGKVEIVNGYFVHHFSPEGLPPVSKHVVFVIDESGSMSGTKIYQKREAMLTILDQLRDGDTFNIVTFSTYVETWQRDKMIPVTPDSIRDAKTFSRDLRASGMTNFYGGLEDAISVLDAFHVSTGNEYLEKALSMIVILSDGLPSAGTTGSEQIKRQTKDLITGRYSLFTLGFGNDVDDTFLEKLAGQNQGIFRKIHVDSDSSLQLASFFDEVATPLALNIEFHYRGDEVDSNAVTQTEFPTYFMGSEIVVAGKLADGVNEVVGEVIMTASRHGMVMGTLVEGNAQLTENTMLSHHVVGDFTQRLWAYLTIKELLRKRLVSDDKAEKDEFEKRALDLSIKHHFVTPLTSLVVVKPDGSNDTTGEAPPPTTAPYDGYAPPVVSNVLAAPRMNYRVPHNIMVNPNAPMHFGGGLPGPLGPPGPIGPIPRRRPGQIVMSVDSDPHFLLHAPNGNVTVCFNVMGKSGQIFNLIKDTELGLNINARVQRAVPHPELLKKHHASTADFTKRTVFDQLAITTPNHRILVTSSSVTTNDDLVLPWTEFTTVNDPLSNFSFAIREGKFLHLKVREDVELIVMLHDVSSHHPGKSDYFGLYVVNGSGFSPDVHGLIGQFERNQVHLYRESIHDDSNLDRKAILRVEDRTVDVVHASRDVLLTGKTETCWFAANNGKGLIDGVFTDYLQDAL